MQTVSLNDRHTSRLGFGGSLLGSTSPAEARRLLNTAFDAGIRHFDVAPLYAFGRSETLLREALGDRRQQITITTKYGLAPTANGGLKAVAHRLARTALSSFPALKNRMKKAAATAQNDAPRLPPLTAEEAVASLEASLRNLGTETIDLFLLHEATPLRLTDDALLDFLERSKQQGRIREFGIGSESRSVRACLLERPAYCRFLQFEWSALAPNDLTVATPQIHHGSLGGGDERTRFTTWLHADAARCARWSHTANADLNDAASINRLLFKAALLQHPGSILLFSTKSERNIHANIATLEDSTLDTPAKTLQALIRDEYPATV